MSVLRRLRPFLSVWPGRTFAVPERCEKAAKDLRKLRAIVPDPVARAHFLSEEGEIDSAMLRLGPAPKKKAGLASDLASAETWSAHVTRATRPDEVSP